MVRVWQSGRSQLVSEMHSLKVTCSQVYRVKRQYHPVSWQSVITWLITTPCVPNCNATDVVKQSELRPLGLQTVIRSSSNRRIFLALISWEAVPPVARIGKAMIITKCWTEKEGRNPSQIFGPWYWPVVRTSFTAEIGGMNNSTKGEGGVAAMILTDPKLPSSCGQLLAQI